ncbi:helix-turn-helix domain-containing protein [Nitrospirillum iridis]|uniref:Transcriptional regulator with XRE-family HTH domain n=1 Tax=Nitrospirillum iridis TaxID=765888 RepID=A0A7X0EAF7_9PROT|nr:helix-turn-helix transcriptional regulator [Nitrospirillum iridis]MBB6249522.1 transcriptional regulator with XRE-family HTH domain [Nitrospirillum iridis]
MHIGLRVKTARQRAGLTQEALAEAVGKATETISNIERGFALTGLDTLQRISDAVGSPMIFFFEDIQDSREVSRRRLEKELHILMLIRSLSDKDLQVMSTLAETLTQQRRF